MKVKEAIMDRAIKSMGDSKKLFSLEAVSADFSFRQSLIGRHHGSPNIELDTLQRVFHIVLARMRKGSSAPS
jgi:hypothetical protein